MNVKLKKMIGACCIGSVLVASSAFAVDQGIKLTVINKTNDSMGLIALGYGKAEVLIPPVKSAPGVGTQVMPGQSKDFMITRNLDSDYKGRLRDDLIVNIAHEQQGLGYDCQLKGKLMGDLTAIGFLNEVNVTTGESGYACAVEKTSMQSAKLIILPLMAK